MPGATMTEAELLGGLFDSPQTILTLVSLFFAIVSGYIAGLYDWSKEAGVRARAGSIP
jgi:hypothetical protein